MSYYFKNKYQFSHHGLVRIKSRLGLKQKNDLEVINYCVKLIEDSHEVYETEDFNYVKVNQKELYFIIKNSNNLIITLTPIKPERMLENFK